MAVVVCHLFFFGLASIRDQYLSSLFAWSPSCLTFINSLRFFGFLTSYVLIIVEPYDAFIQMRLVFIDLLYLGCDLLCFILGWLWSCQVGVVLVSLYLLFQGTTSCSSLFDVLRQLSYITLVIISNISDALERGLKQEILFSFLRSVLWYHVLTNVKDTSIHIWCIPILAMGEGYWDM